MVTSDLLHHRVMIFKFQKFGRGLGIRTNDLAVSVGSPGNGHDSGDEVAAQRGVD